MNETHVTVVPAYLGNKTQLTHRHTHTQNKWIYKENSKSNCFIDVSFLSIIDSI